MRPNEDPAAAEFSAAAKTHHIHSKPIEFFSRPGIHERQVEARVGLGFGQAAVISERFPVPIDRRFDCLPRYHHLQLALSPAPQAVGCYPDCRGHGFEHIGELFMAPAGFAMHVRSDCQVQKSVTCDFDLNSAELWFDSDMEWTKRRLVNSLDIKHGEIRRRLFRMAAELQRPGFGSEVLVESMVIQIGVELIRYFRGIDASPVSGGLSPWRLRRIDEALAQDPGGADLAALATLVGLSVRHLTRAFRASRGISLSEQIAQSRLDLACRMLLEGVSIKQTAAAAGFSAPTNFSVAFRRATGSTPREYRERAAAARTSMLIN